MVEEITMAGTSLMTIAVHRTVRRFEQFLFTLDVFFLLLAVFYLWNKAWLVGFSLLVLSVLTAIIGQALPHRKRQRGKELGSGIPLPIYDGQLSTDDAVSLARAMQRTALIIGLAALVITRHEGYHWYWALLAAIGAYIFFRVAFPN